MNKGIMFLVPLALVGLMLVGCASIPAKVTPDDSLVVIKTEFVNPDNLPRGREIRFNYSGDYPPSWVGQYSWDFNIVVIKEPGVTLKTISTQLQANFRGEPWEEVVNWTLPYEPGQIVIADYVFVRKIEKTGEHSQSGSMGFRKITDQEKADLMAAIKSDGRFGSWTQ